VSTVLLNEQEISDVQEATGKIGKLLRKLLTICVLPLDSQMPDWDPSRMSSARNQVPYRAWLRHGAYLDSAMKCGSVTRR
jgi:hypothetical protein